MIIEIKKEENNSILHKKGEDYASRSREGRTNLLFN